MVSLASGVKARCFSLQGAARTFGIVIGLLLLASSPASFASADLEAWIQTQDQLAVQKLQKNISPAGTHPGVVIASPSRTSPDYYFHWVRDAALVMGTQVDTY